MPIWRNIVSSEDYQRLPLGERVKTKNEFFSNVISKSEKFKSLIPQEQAKIKTDFFAPKPEEKLEPYFEGKPTFGKIAQFAAEEFQTKSPFALLDKPVEEVAKFIEPDTAQEGLVGALKFIPRQMAADVVRAYKPSTAGAFGMGMKVAKPLVKPLVKPVGKFIGKVVPEGIKTALKRELFVGRGQPQAYQEMAKEALLERQAGGREAEQVAKTLTTKPTGEALLAKKALLEEGLSDKAKKILEKEALKREPLTGEEQRYIGRIFRKEVDIGGKISNINLTPEQSAKIVKNVEVEVAFNPELKTLNEKLININKALQDKETFAKGLIGKEFRTETGFIEKAKEVSKIPKLTPSGKLSKKRFDIGIKSEPMFPKPPTKTNIPKEMFPEEEIIRGTKQISKAPTVNEFINKPRETLLQQRKQVATQIQDKIKDIEIGVRSNYALFDRTFSEAIKVHPKYQQLSTIAQEGRAVMDKWSTELAKSGIPKEEASRVIEENIGSYMARMYSSKLKPQFNLLGEAKNLRLRLNGLKHRKDLSEEVRNLMGEIKEPALPTAIRVKEISSSIANNKLFSKVAANPEWVADRNITGKLVKMPDTANVGALRNKWVIPEIGEDINAIVDAGKQAEGVYSKLLNAWKFGKVALNPATQVRNAISNTMLLDISGTNHIRQAQLFPKAFGELLSKGKIYQQAIEDGAVGGEYIGGEIKKLKDFYTGSQGSNLQKWLNILKMPTDKAGKIYQGMEQSAKLVKYMDVLEKTGNRKLAAEEAQKWLFDYSKVPKIVDWARKSSLGAPFITFTYKSTPRLAEALVNRPMALYKYKALFDAFNETSRKYQGMLPTEYARQKRMLPDYVLKDIGGVPTNLLMPWKDKYNRTQWLNLEYILPLGQSPEILEKGLKGFVGNPVFNLVADLSKNSDFRGKPIIPLGADKGEATQAVVSYIYRQLAPSLAPGIPFVSKGGYSWEKLMDAIHKRPDFVDRVRELTPTLFDTLAGLKINALDVDEAESFKLIDKKKKIDALRSQFYKLQHPAISEKERNRQVENIFKKIQRVMEER